jgi:hypothetical protein
MRPEARGGIQYTVIGRKFKFEVQDSFLEYFFLEIWRFKKHWEEATFNGPKNVNIQIHEYYKSYVSLDKS